ncbi:uncharacterized protein LOC123716516 [Pieris brassicae]|uniref:uncharacterized protein LOC123716516 n=1 Tax=Pieris brassicae TaxID=7116 RepID=UPI001E661A37|nr:uncharacterized protein LOC123716516 [Pieris brassicae]
MVLRSIDYILASILIVAVIATLANAQPPTAEESIGQDRFQRQSSVRAGKSAAIKPKWGFFGTIFSVILEEINDTKSAYNQISELVNNQFVDEKVVIPPPDKSNNGTSPSPKITRKEFLNILDRNLKGLARLRNLEWREAKKDSWNNIQGYWNELFGDKKKRTRRANSH